MARVNQSCNLTPEEETRVKKYFEDEYWLNKEEEDELQDRMENYVFYEPDAHSKVRHCVCTHPACGEFYVEKSCDPVFFKQKHGAAAVCPRCGQPVQLMALGKIRNFSSINSTRETRFTDCRRAPDGGLLMASGYASRYFDFEDLRPVIDVSWSTKTYLHIGKRMQWIRRGSAWLGGYTGWQCAKTVSEPFRPSYPAYSYGNDGDGYFIGLQKALESSSLKYSQLDTYMAEEYQVALDEGIPMRNAVKYLSAYTDYPNLEMAVKIGFFEATSNLVISGVKNFRDLDWKAKNIQGFLRLDKQDCNAFLRSGGNLELLKWYHKAKKSGKARNMEDYLDIVEAAGGVKNLYLLMESVDLASCTLRQGANYIQKQAGEPRRALQIWRDYLDAAENLELDLTQRDVAMPKDLPNRHDHVISLQKFRESQAFEERTKNLTKGLQKMYDFSLGGYRIVVPKNPEEIIREGRILHHCVGGYADRHFRGDLVILFLRRERKPNCPYLTIEMKARRNKRDPVELRQIHGYRNEGYQHERRVQGKRTVLPREKFSWFLDAWMDWVKAGSPRDKDGRPIIKEDTTA